MYFGLMSAPRWDGKLYRPVKPNEGLQPGTLDWKDMQDQRRFRRERAIERRAEGEILLEQARLAASDRNRKKSEFPETHSFFFLRALERLWDLIWHR